MGPNSLESGHTAFAALQNDLHGQSIGQKSVENSAWGNQLHSPLDRIHLSERQCRILGLAAEDLGWRCLLLVSSSSEREPLPVLDSERIHRPFIWILPYKVLASGTLLGAASHSRIVGYVPESRLQVGLQESS